MSSLIKNKKIKEKGTRGRVEIQPETPLTGSQTLHNFSVKM
jgi:hypothetical protein